MNLKSLLQRVGLSKSDPNAEPTALDRNVAALRVSLESIEKAGLPEEEKDAFVTETVRQFRESLRKGDEDEECADEGMMHDEGDEDEETEDETSKSINKSTEEDASMTPEQIKKFDEAIAAVEKMTAVNTALSAENKALTERVAKMEAADADRVRLAKATAMAAGTGLQPEAVAKLLAETSEAGQATLAQTFEALRKSQSDAALFNEIGAIGTAGSPTDAITSYAANIRKADPSLTEEQALAKAYRDNPAAYAEARAAEDEAMASAKHRR